MCSQCPLWARLGWVGCLGGRCRGSRRWWGAPRQGLVWAESQWGARRLLGRGKGGANAVSEIALVARCLPHSGVEAHPSVGWC